MAHSKGKKTPPNRNIPENNLMADTLDKEFNATVLKMFKELRGNVDKVRKAKCKHQ